MVKNINLIGCSFLNNIRILLLKPFNKFCEFALGKNSLKLFPVIYNPISNEINIIFPMHQQISKNIGITLG